LCWFQELVRKEAKYQAAGFSDELLLVGAETDLRAMDNSSSAQDQALNAKQAELIEAETATAKLAAKAKELKQAAEQAIEEASQETSAEAQRIRNDENPTLEQVRADQEEVEARLNCTVDVSHLVLEQYDKRAEEVSRCVCRSPKRASGG